MSGRGREGTNGLALSDEEPLVYLARWVLRWKALSADAKRPGIESTVAAWANEMANRWYQLATVHVRQHHDFLLMSREGRELVQLLQGVTPHED